MNAPLAPSWVDLRQVSVRYGRVQALDQVSLCIAPGERVALVGANGSGKSTLLRVLHGLADAAGGGFQCDATLQQAMLFQRPHMLRTSAQNNVALALWLRGTRWRDARAQALACELLRKLDQDRPRLHRYVAERAQQFSFLRIVDGCTDGRGASIALRVAGNEHAGAPRGKPFELHPGGDRDRQQVPDIRAFRLAGSPVTDGTAMDAGVFCECGLRQAAMPAREPDTLR